MSVNTLHNPLEVLLFFQSLRDHGIDNESFSRISRILQENEYIKQGNNYDPNRLSAESLRTLYVNLLKDERRKEENTTISTREGEPNPKRRKLSTPPPQNLDEAAGYGHLIPNVVDRLYTRYRDHVVQAIQEEEKRYRDLSREIEEIEQGRWDARLIAGDSTPKAKAVPSIQALLRDEPENEINGTRASYKAHDPEEAQAGRISQAAVTNGYPISKDPTAVPAGSKNPSLETHKQKHASSPQLQSTLPPRNESSQAQARPPSQSQPPVLPPPFSPAEHQRQFAGVQSMPGPPAASPRLTQRSSSSNERASGSSIILPPPPALLRSSPTALTPAIPSSTPSSIPQVPHPHPPPPILPSKGFAQQSYAYYNPNVGYHPPYSSYTPPATHPYGAPQAQGQIPPYMTPTPGNYKPPVIPANTPHYPPPGHLNTFQSAPPASYGQRPIFPPNISPRPAGHATAPATPIPNVNDRRRPHGLPRIDTSVSSTPWKPTPKHVPKDLQKSPVAPELSPYLPSSTSPSPEPEPLKLDTQVRKAMTNNDTPSRTPTRGRGRGRWGGRGSRGRGGRGGAASSPAITTPMDVDTPSQSVRSATEETIAARAVKAEPPSTPAPRNDSPPVVSTPVDEPSRPSGRRSAAATRQTPAAKTGQKRKRASTIENTPEIPVTPALVNPSTQPLTRPTHVLASRNFTRVVAPLLNEVQSHKLASLFAKPITERDAPGYKSLVYHPTDIKSIRGAISAGNRFVATLPDISTGADGEPGTPAAAATPSSGTTGGRAAGSILVERTSDVMPPKAIVSSAQLEKELTRMFANAVMFNPDPKRGFGPGFKFSGRLKKIIDDGDEDEEMEDADEEDEGGEDEGGEDESGRFVRDAREMFEDVERSVQGWRRAESFREDSVGPGRGTGGGGAVGKREESAKAESVPEDTGWGAEDGLRRSRRG